MKLNHFWTYFIMFNGRILYSVGNIQLILAGLEYFFVVFLQGKVLDCLFIVFLPGKGL